MEVKIDTARGTLDTVGEDGAQQSLSLFSPQAFSMISRIWLKSGWATKYSYDFTWLGLPVIQLPEDLIRVQEVIWKVKPDIIIETGLARGGSAIFYASLLQLLGRGRVISIDIEIRPKNRRAVQEHFLANRIVLVEGSSTDPATFSQVRSLIRPGEVVLVVLDSCHTKAHVLEELEMYNTLVSKGSYIIAADGIMSELHDVPGGNAEWALDNPAEAVRQFLKKHPEFEVDPTYTRTEITYWPTGYLTRSR